MAHDVFISYSNKDKAAADAACSIMEQKGIRCWMAPRDITPGLPFAEAIIDGIKESKVFILIYSSNSNNSSQVIKEVDRAVHHRLAIIPLRLEDVPMTKQLEYYVSDVHWMDALTPPLEAHIEKLCRVVKILLSMGTLGSENIESAFETGLGGRDEETYNKRRTIKRILIPSIFVFLAAFIIGILFMAQRHSKVKWAREVAIPEIKQMVEDNDVWRNLVKPYYLAVKAESILGQDSVLAALISQCSANIDIMTEPEGAKVYVKEYIHPDTTWSFLGITPLKNFRVPIGIFRWKVEKEGYDTVYAATLTMGANNNFMRKLDKNESLPPGMVRVSGTETDAGYLGDFFIGLNEVSNHEYKAFIDAGGYRNRDFWKYAIVKDDRQITWEAAMAAFVDKTGLVGPSIWLGGSYPDGQGNYPVSGVSWYEAEAYAEWAGMSLPTSFHWNVARGGLTPMLRVPQLGGFGVLAPFTNFSGKGPVPVGTLSGITAYGANDMAGNVREWCWNETKVGRVIRGGSWEDNTYEFGNERNAPPMDRSPRNGFRLAKYINPDSIPEVAFGLRSSSFEPESQALKPVSDAIFKIYKEQFSYDHTDLNSIVESRKENPEGWVQECISFDAAYGNERIIAHLFLPSGISPPYQTVIYFPGSAATYTPSSENIESYYEFTMFLSYLVRNGRAILFPVYKGTFERGDPKLNMIHIGTNTHAYTDFLVQITKDFKRCIDYLQTRTDIDSNKLAYYGMSWGGLLGAIIPALEERLKVSVLLGGGINFHAPGIRPPLAPANQINYVTRVRIPTLMLNGRYDSMLPPETSSKPMFDLLGTPPEDKRLILHETDHIPPRIEYIKETLAWLDKYLGPVR
jgi:formylglycine-generating enzyme required for sulfatase activity/dienelactone hydrolase